MRTHRSTKRHNETKYISINTRLCKACWECIESCPKGVIGKVNLPFHKHARIDNAEGCQGCHQCVTVCQQQAITAYRID
ncbi:MAG: ferredoxin family protein [Dehalococcoidaceae bacterium]|nr:ferredoxin family protein [Dehalococcoidaceae bacterium]